MSIRTRLLLILLAVSVVPLLVAALTAQFSTRLLGGELTGATNARLERQAEAQLADIVRDAARLADAEARTVELVVEVQALAARRALELAAADEAALRPDPGAIGFRFARRDFDDRPGAVPGFETNPRYTVIGHDGSERPRRVSLRAQSILLPAGATLGGDALRDARIARDVWALGSMIPAYRALLDRAGPLIFGQYTATAAGVHGKYPGHGGYPEDFDPRERRWYTDAARLLDGDELTGASAWVPPTVDATTRHVVITVSRAVRLDAGSPEPDAVTAVDIRLKDLVRFIAPTISWSDREQAFIVSTPRAGDAGEREGGVGGEGEDRGLSGFEIYAQQDYEAEPRDWRTRIEVEPFELDRAALERIRGNLDAGRGGVIRTVREGREVLLAHASLAPANEAFDAALFVEVPYADAVRLARDIDQRFGAIVLAQLRSNGLIFLGVLMLALAVAVRASRAVTQPVKELSDAVDRVAAGDLDAHADVRRDDELGRLAANFNLMVPKLRDRVRLRDALDLAMEVQQALLPKSAPTVPGLDIHGVSHYCDETGGDYFDFLQIDPEPDAGRVHVVIGDVTGHGVAAALLMTTARALLRSRVALPGGLAQQVADINRHLASDNTHGRFMTLAAVLFDQRAGTIRTVLAGHDPPITFDPRTGAFGEIAGAGDGIPLGIEPDWRYGEHARPPLAPGEVLLIGTDGIWEQRSPAGEMFGKDRLRELLREHSSEPAERLAERVTAAVRAFRAETPQSDDITLVVVKGRSEESSRRDGPAL